MNDVAGGHLRREQLLEAAEELLVLQLLVGEADERLERDLVAEPMVAADLEDLRAMKRSARPNQVGVACGPDLAQEPSLGGVEETRAARRARVLREGTTCRSRSRGPRITSGRSPHRTRREASMARA
jgi:hypothetical protein